MSGTEKNPMEKRMKTRKDVSMPLSQTEGNKSFKKLYAESLQVLDIHCIIHFYLQRNSILLWSTSNRSASVVIFS